MRYSFYMEFNHGVVVLPILSVASFGRCAHSGCDKINIMNPTSKLAIYV